MYLGQIVAVHALTGSCGGSDERKVVLSITGTKGVSVAMAQALVDLAVYSGELVRVRCQCHK